MMIRVLLLSALFATPALAEGPMSAEAFDRYATGKTLFYGSGGTPYGAEQYLPGRKVIWTFLDGDCRQGLWYEENGLICFRYERDPEAPQCWSFFEEDGGLIARFENDPAARVLIEVEQSPEPLSCPAPYIGA